MIQHQKSVSLRNEAVSPNVAHQQRNEWETRMQWTRMQCEIKASGCWRVASRVVYRYGGRYESCEHCFIIIQKELNETHPKISPSIAEALELYQTVRTEPTNGQARHSV